MMSKHLKQTIRHMAFVLLMILVATTVMACYSSGEREIIAEYILNPDGESYTLNHYQGEDEINVVIPKTYEEKPITIIGGSAFLGNNDIETIIISNNIVEIGTYAFRDMQNLKEITFEENSSLTTLKDGVFEWSDQLKNITLPKSVINIHDETFHLAYGLENIHVEEGNSVYASQDGILFNKNYTEILKYPDGKVGLTYQIPETVTRIGNSAFNLQHELSTVTFHPNTQVTSIGKRAFFGSTLTSFVVPKTVLTIEDSAFTAMSELTSFTFELNSQLQSMGHLVFESNHISTITLPASLMEIENDTFSSTPFLTEVLVEESNQHFKSVNGILFSKIGYRLYLVPEAMELVSYVVPKEVVHIEGLAFARVASLTSLTFEEGSQIQTIGEEAFAGTNIITFTLPNTVTHVGEYAFSSIQALSTFLFENNSQLLVISNDMFRYNGKLVSIIIPKSVTTIGDRAFFGTKLLESIQFEENTALEKIGDHAFANNHALESFIIPIGVTTMGTTVFANSNHIIIYAESESPKAGWDEEWNTTNNPVYWGDEWTYGEGSLPEITNP